MAKWRHVATLLWTFVVTFIACHRAYSDTVGPLTYTSIADSPFDTSRNGIDFFIDDFSERPEIFYRELPPYGIRFPFARLATPGVEASGHVGWTESTITTVGGCTDSIPPSCFSGVGFEFDATELGFLPQAVGVAVSGFGSFSLSAYDAENQLVETTIAPAPALFDDFTGFPPTPAIFIGATHLEGIARIAIHSNEVMFELDDFQYGRLVPEPSAFILATLAILVFTTPRRCAPKGRSRPLLA